MSISLITNYLFRVDGMVVLDVVQSCLFAGINITMERASLIKITPKKKTNLANFSAQLICFSLFLAKTEM